MEANEVLVGVAEFALWQTATRLLVVAVVSRFVYFAVFASRPGFGVATRISLIDTVKSLLAFVRRNALRHGRRRRVLLALALFLLSLSGLATDFAVSTLFATYVRSREIEVVWVRPTNTLRRQYLPSAEFGVPIFRHAVNQVLAPLVRSKYPSSTGAWFRVFGTLSDVDVAAARIPGRCGDVAPPPPPNGSEPLTNGVDPAPLTYDPPADSPPGVVLMESASARQPTVFGYQQRIVTFGLLTLDEARPDGFVFMLAALPIPLTRSAQSSGLVRPVSSSGPSGLWTVMGLGAGQSSRQQQSPDMGNGAATLSSRASHVGVTSLGPTLAGYEQQCGLTPDEVRAWLEKYVNTPNTTEVATDRYYALGQNKTLSTRVGVYYADETAQIQTSTVTGSTVATFFAVDSDLLRRGETEFLTFGSMMTENPPADKLTSLVTASDHANLLARAAVPRENRTDAGAAIPVYNTTHVAVSSFRFACNETYSGTGAFFFDYDAVPPRITLRNDTDAKVVTGASDDPLGWLRDLPARARARARKPDHCTIWLSGAASSYTNRTVATPAALRELPVSFLSGAQVCRTRMTTYVNPLPAFDKRFGEDDGGLQAVSRPGDFVVAVQDEPQERPLDVRCMDPEVVQRASAAAAARRGDAPDDSAPTKVPHPWLGLASLTQLLASDDATDSRAGWGQARVDSINSGGLAAEGSAAYPTWMDPDGQQLYSTRVVRIAVWELLASAGLFVLLVALGLSRLPSMYSTVLPQLYSNALIEPPARTRRRAAMDEEETVGRTDFAVGPDATAFIDCADPAEQAKRHSVSRFDLTRPTVFALVEYPHGADPTSPLPFPSHAVLLVDADQRSVVTPFGLVPLAAAASCATDVADSSSASLMSSPTPSTATLVDPDIQLVPQAKPLEGDSGERTPVPAADRPTVMYTSNSYSRVYRRLKQRLDELDF
ncbi:hypothetical protein H9P43_009218 [Blastocladiella emersonii ATCC 22665]|nr:hypothetical protein H9P43_009199 [Blastocladiella emersonii ATCC 22665]KAI9152427.1 hypothetical protein H9P43_009218 [Blastocladiella emersonii ATCC 22665]